MGELRLFEVRLGGLVTVRVVTTSHVRALELALRQEPIKDDDAVVVTVLPKFILDTRS